MKITLTLDYSELQKIITESPTMRTLVYAGQCPIIKCKNKFLAMVRCQSLDNHQKEYNGSTKVLAIKFLRKEFHLDSDLKDKLISLRCLVNPEGNLGLASAKNIVEKYFY